jgi:hypothetical protein
MPIDTSMYQAAIRPATSVVGDLGQLNQQGLNRLQLATGQQNFDEQKAVIGEKNALRQALGSGQIDLSTPQGRSQLYSVAPTLAPGVLKTMQDQITAQALAAKDTAQAGNFKSESAATDYKTANAKSDKAITDIANFTNPADALASLQAHHASGDIDDTKYQSVLTTLAPSLQDPTQFGGWKRQMVLGILDAKDKIAATAPKVEMTNTGGAIVPTNVNADAGPVGPVAGAAPIRTTVSPDTLANNATSRANNTANIQKDLQVAGVNPDGSISGDQQALIDKIGRGQMAAPNGMALRNPRMAALMAQVAQQYPEYDATTYGAKVAAARAFTSGQQGNALRSVSTANNHLDQLSKLVDALDNGQNQTVNQISNTVSAWNGGTAPTNFDAVKNIVGQEVVKAIVAGGGSAGERDEAAGTFSKAKSPQQLQQAISHYRMIMGAQQANLLEQRRAAGLPDSTLPNYNTGGEAAPAAVPSMPSGFKITHIDGKPQ